MNVLIQCPLGQSLRMHMRAHITQGHMDLFTKSVCLGILQALQRYSHALGWSSTKYFFLSASDKVVETTVQ